jgi:2-polyprenyl-3-methyl-5-hydroxy-6-metoxy-1,4-benzoquinol methylase
MKEHQSIRAASFDGFAKTYARRDQVTGGFITDWLRGVLATHSGDTAIDLGCGTGNVAALLAERYRHVRGVDLSGPMIELARQLHPDAAITFEVGDLTEVRGQYDLVVSIMTLHHLPDQAAALRHLASLVKPGGMAVVADVTGNAPATPWVHYRWAVHQLAAEVRNALRNFRVNTERSWVDHLVTDEWLEPEVIEGNFLDAFPGATIAHIGSHASAAWVCTPAAPRAHAQV